MNDDNHFGLWVGWIIHSLTKSGDWTCNVLMKEERFARLNLATKAIALKLESVNDVPVRVGEIQNHPILGRMDTAENILANKVTAIIDRAAPKDFADIWGFACQKGLPLQEAITDAQSKAAGIFPADLARVLCSITPEDWQVIRWINAPPVEVFLSQVNDLGEKLLLMK